MQRTFKKNLTENEMTGFECEMNNGTWYQSCNQNFYLELEQGNRLPTSSHQGAAWNMDGTHCAIPSYLKSSQIQRRI
ncbi:hypothetical protein JZ751_007398 [Albula glossodonta]|uniref:Uncharacterized protein n=1 Tax=Albula glossodonta TaxID=121402 RepID=A0A8T2NDM3_9TELE|nr:hypothetical protein JZ751_007398 [Albula glossodonta]